MRPCMFFFSLGLMAGYVTLSPSQWANEKVIEPPRDRLLPPLPTTSRIVIVQRVETTLILNLTSLQNAIAVAFPLTIVEVVSLKKNCTATREITIAQRATFAMVAVHGASLAAGNAMFLPVGNYQRGGRSAEGFTSEDDAPLREFPARMTRR